MNPLNGNETLESLKETENFHTILFEVPLTLTFMIHHGILERVPQGTFLGNKKTRAQG